MHAASWPLVRGRSADLAFSQSSAVLEDDPIDVDIDDDGVRWTSSLYPQQYRRDDDEDVIMSTATVTIDPLSSSPPHTTFLNPARRQSLLLLLPLLPVLHIQPLPVELWARIVVLAVRRAEGEVRSEEDERWRWSVLRVCRWWKRVALPELYSHPHLPTLSSFDSLHSHLRATDALWSPLHRTPYSTPAGWIRSLDLSLLPPHLTNRQLLQLNSHLQSLWPMLPRLEDVVLRREWMLSAGVVKGLGECCPLLRRVAGITWRDDKTGRIDEAVTFLLRSCRGLEELHIYGTGMPHTPLPLLSPTAPEGPLLRLDQLHTLALIGLPSAPFLSLLLHSPLPALKILTLTPYNHEPRELSTPFLRSHGPKLLSLSFARGPEWPSLPISPPTNLLTLCPDLRSLSLLHPLPQALDPPSHSHAHMHSDPHPHHSHTHTHRHHPHHYPHTQHPPTTAIHPLTHLSLPRPLLSPEYSHFLLHLPFPNLPSLRQIQLQEFRWLRQLGRAGDTGARRAMLELAGGLRGRGVRVVDERGVGAF